MNVASACTDFLAHCRVAKNLSAHSLRAYAIDLKEFERFAGPGIEIAAVDRQLLRRCSCVFDPAVRQTRGSSGQCSSSSWSDRAVPLWP
ncbi:site-specific integrase [Azospirillum sp. sgz302134]